MNIVNNFKQIKLRWKLAVIFMLIPILIFILVNLSQTLSQYLKTSGFGNSIVKIYIFPIELANILLSQVECNSLACVIYFKLPVTLGFLLLFYAIIGFLLGYLIEKRKKK